MAAALSDYFYWWQGVLLAASVVVWVFGAGALLWVGGRFIAKAPKATFRRALAANVLGGMCASLGVTLLNLSMRTVPGPALFAGGYAGGVAVYCLIVMAMFRTTFPKAVLAWLPTIPAGIVAVAMLVSMLMPTLVRGREMARRVVCRMNLYQVDAALRLYMTQTDGDMPPSLDVLLESAGMGRRCLSCPSDERRGGVDYFYLPARANDDPMKIVACDFGDNHRGEGRNVLFRDGRVVWLTQAEFQAELARPHNAAFAKALGRAEATRLRRRPAKALDAP